MRRLADLAIVAGVAVLVLVLSSSRPTVHAAVSARPVTWRGLVGDGPRPGVDVGRQMIVVLESPSLADRVAAHGGKATEQQEQKWTSYALAQQRLLLSRLEVQGVRIQPEFSFGRVLAGFSALLDPTAVSLLERDHAVQGVYPVRVAYPSSISSDALSKRALASSVGNADLSLPGYDGRGITIALLDTGVDRTHPSLLGSLAAGVDIVDPEGDATPQAPPGRPSQIERHGTELAGILAGDRGPPASRGIARGASVLPIRVAGWQSDGRGGYAIYARTDQLIEGLERAVDPNTNGDAHDAVRVALVGVAAPYAGFADDPAARAIGGAVRLNTLVVTGAGNDGRAGPGFGSISGPGGAPAALTVGAADMRSHTQQVRVSLRVGLQVALDRMLPLSGESAPANAFTSPIAAPALAQGRVPFTSPHAYFTRNGLSLVAGRTALVPAGESPTETARSAARAGATAVLVYGARLPAGGVPLDEDTAVPVVSIPSSVAAKLVRAIATGRDAAASIGVPHARANHGAPSVAPFSSTGLAYDGRVKPDIVAPGVAIATATPGPAGDPVGSYTTVSGSSASAAAVAGAAAVLAEARPLLDASALRSVLTGTARRLPSTAVTDEGAGLVALGGASAGELATSPTTLAFGNARSVPWHRWQDVVVRNVSPASAPRARHRPSTRRRRRARPRVLDPDELRASAGKAAAREPRRRRVDSSGRRPRRTGQHRPRRLRWIRDQPPVGRHVRATVRQRPRSAQAVDRRFLAVDDDTRAADVPRGAARPERRRRRRSARLACCASTCSTQPATTSALWRRFAICSRGGTRSVSPEEAPPETRSERADTASA